MKKSIAIFAAVIVTVLWSTSYFINKIAFNMQIGPFMLAGIRYLLAGAVLLVMSQIMQKKKHTESSVKLSIRQLVLLGITGFFMAQGLQYAGQRFLMPTQTSLVLNITNTTTVLLLEVLWLKENKFSTALAGIFILIIGSCCYFYPFSFAPEDLFGIGLVTCSSVGYVLNLALNRIYLKNKSVDTAQLIAWPMVIGSICLIAISFIINETVIISPELILIILWLAIVNGTAAFYLWTWCQKTLTILETSLINNLMLIEIALIDVLFLNRVLTALQWIGIGLVALAILIVQYLRIKDQQKKLGPVHITKDEKTA